MRCIKEETEDIMMTVIDMELNQIVERGIASHASDLHFIPHRDRVELHMRTGDVLEPLMKISQEKYQVMLQKVKASSAMNLSEKRLPQDGVMTIFERAVRVSTMRSLHGESLVIRLFDQEVGTLETLGIPEDRIASLLEVLRERAGITLIAGETGMGKSTTLYSLMGRLSTEGYKVISIEDPVEREIEGVIQCQINDGAGFTYDRAIFASLRQDPDFVCIGEIRNMETAGAMVRAALTGHRVISTIHSTGYGNVLKRLVDFGLRKDDLQSAIRMVMTQDLKRKEGRRVLHVDMEIREGMEKTETGQGEVLL